MTRLANYLVRPYKTDHEKTRAIFRWLTDRIAYNAEGLLSGDLGDNRAPAVFKNRKAVCEGYANLFSILCEQAGIKAVKVVGHARDKDAVWKLGNQTLPGAPHAWNAVNISGRWRLLDATWAAGHLKAQKYVKEFDEYYFLPAHEELLFTHFPDDARWQLRPKPISLKEFKSHPHVRSELFRLGITPAQLRKEMKQKATNEFVRAFGRSKKTKIIEVPLTRFLKTNETYTFSMKSEEFPVIVAISLGTQNTVRADKKGTEFTLTVTPEPGILRISGGEIAPGQNGTYKAILEYVVVEN